MESKSKKVGIALMALKLKSKEKERAKPKKNFKGSGLKIVDDDSVLSFGGPGRRNLYSSATDDNYNSIENIDDDEHQDAEDLPQIAAVIDERPVQIQSLEQFFVANKWKQFGSTNADQTLSNTSNRNSRVETSDKNSRVESYDRHSRIEGYDKSSRVENNDRHSRIEGYDKSSRIESKDRSSRIEGYDKNSRVERNDRSSRIEGYDKSSRTERNDRNSRVESNNRSSRIEGYDKRSRLDSSDRNSRIEGYDKSSRVESVDKSARIESYEKNSKTEEPPHSQSSSKRTLDGKKAGLQRASDLRQEMVEHRKRENEIFSKMDASLSGKGAETKVRDRKTAKEREADNRKKEEEDKFNKERKQQYDKWGKGLKQVESHQERLGEAIHEMSKPLARYKDDEDLDAHLRAQDREGDPMLAMLSKKKSKRSGEPSRPKYTGPQPLPNRFQIPPGYRWDGVDRSSGYEKEWFSRINAKKALEEESYKWSVEDL